MWISDRRRPSSGRWLLVLAGLCSTMLCVSAESHTSSSSSGSGSMIQDLRAALGDLAGEGRAYLGRLAGEQTLLSVQKAFSKVFKVVAENVAGGLNVILQYISHLFETAGINVTVPARVTPSGVIFVAQWILVALLTYWIISLTFQLVASTLRRALWLLKIGVALFFFVLILRDYGVGTETMAVRLSVLVLVCVLLGVGSAGWSGATDKTGDLEEQVRVLERRLREMERWRKTDE
ncbi:voltage-gated monoatomic cation channel TMEM109-like [Eucyclogobius newberryi]|uniref:voltage-gated monoatomic cation channel TMEM109-like n=1 Tax=Eucyclogobius newberryi TaxID=166745 RepID=UPI003B59E29E